MQTFNFSIIDELDDFIDRLAPPSVLGGLSLLAKSVIAKKPSADDDTELSEPVAPPVDLARIITDLKKVPKTVVSPKTRKVEVNGYERCEPKGEEWCSKAGLTMDQGALARMVASEVGRLPVQYMIGVVECVLNECKTKGITPFQRITMDGIRIRGGKVAKSAGYFGRQSGRWCASIVDPTRQHAEVAKTVLSHSTSKRLVARDGRRWVDGKVMDHGRQNGKPLTYNAVTLVEKWGKEGWEWIGQVYEADGKTLLIDPYILMMFRHVGKGANIKAGVDAMLDGRRRWRVKV